VRHLIVVCLLTLLLPATAVQADRVVRRGTDGEVIGRLVQIDDNGVTLRRSSGAEVFTPWDRVRTFDTANDSTPLIREYRRRAVDLWRARSRLERGDAALAEPLFEQLFEQYRGRTHETALVVSEGLLRCRLMRGAHALAVIPALESARLRRAGIATRSYSLMPVVIDDELHLCPNLPPIWAPTRSLDQLVIDLTHYDPSGDDVIAALRDAYLLAAARQAGQPDPPPSRTRAPQHPGLEWLALFNTALFGDLSERNDVIGRLQAMPIEDDAWREAWRLAVIGLARVSSPGEGRQRRGMVDLLTIAARFADTQPYLAGMSLAVVAQGLESLGDPDAAQRLRAELHAQYTGHPVRRALTRQVDLRRAFTNPEDSS
jgi:hypothetical protein